MLINVVGLGYIGLPTATMLASNGLQIVGTDYNQKLVETLNSNKPNFKEKGLNDVFKAAVDNGIKFTTAYCPTSVYIIAVPTPYDKATKKLDSRFVVEAVKDVLEVALDEAIVIIESTITPGTIDSCVRPLVDECMTKKNINIHLAHAPERIIPGNMIYELRHNSRTIGADEAKIAERIKGIYSSFCEGEITLTDIRTAEMSKVVENTFRDINIAFANELAKICHKNGLNVYEIIKIANKHPRVHILQPGPGVGGHCISVDPWFLVGDYPETAKLIREAREINDSMPAFVLDRTKAIMAENGITDNSRVGFYGLTYKEDVSDVRESPTLQLYDIVGSDYGFIYYDPYVDKDIVKGQYHDLDKFLANTDIIVLMTGHREILENVDKLAGKIILDTRNKLASGSKIYKL